MFLNLSAISYQLLQRVKPINISNAETEASLTVTTVNDAFLE